MADGPPMTGGGWRPWREAWWAALYGEHGFYRRGEGPAGHFSTSATAGGGVAEEFARALWRLAADHGCTTIVDVGAGRGELLRALSLSPWRPAGRHAAPTELIGVDVVDRPAGLPGQIDWLTAAGGAQLPEQLTGLRATLVVANEWLDVVPVDLLEVDLAGRLRVVEVDAVGTERLGDPPDEATLAWCEQWWPVTDAEPGTRVEVGASRDRAWADLVGRVDTGLCLAIDYGHTRSGRPGAGSLAAHRAGHLVPPVPDGSCDLTAHVALDSLAAGRLTDQRSALSELGIDATLADPQALPASVGPHGRSGGPDSGPDPSAYLRELQRSGAAAVLLDRGGLGGFGWAVTECGRAGAIGQSDQPAAKVVR